MEKKNSSIIIFYMHLSNLLTRTFSEATVRAKPRIKTILIESIFRNFFLTTQITIVDWLFRNAVPGFIEKYCELAL